MKHFLFGILTLITATLMPSQAHALPVAPSRVEFLMNRGAPGNQQVQLGTRITRDKLHVLKATYDFSIHGGASTTTAYSLRDSGGATAKLPTGAVVTNCRILPRTALATASGTATMAFGLVSSNDIKTATNHTSLTTTTATVACIPVNSAATDIGPLAAESTATVTIGGKDLTAGKVDVYLYYLITDL